MRYAKPLLGAAALAAIALSGCTSTELALPETAAAPTPRPEVTAAKADRLEGMIDAYALAYDVPRELVHRVVKRESNYNPKAYSKGNWGLMQIRHGTAKGMGYDGSAEGLLDAETNLKYAVKYLRGAYLVAGGNQDQAVRLYARGYYYDAKRKGLLEETGLKPWKNKGEEVQVASLPSPAQAANIASATAASPMQDAASIRVAAAAAASGGETGNTPEPTAAQAATVAPQPDSSMPAAPSQPATAMSFAGGTPTMPAFAPLPTPSPR